MGAVVEGPCCAGETDPQKSNLISRRPKAPYETKCEKLIKKMEGKIKTKGAIEHDADEQNTWQYISQIADVCRDAVDEFLEKLSNATIKLDTDDTKTDDINMSPPQIIKASVKDESEAKQECESLHNGNWHRVIDCCRANIIYDNYKQLYYILLILAKYNTNCCGFEILKIETNQPQIDQGYGDNKLDIILIIRPVQTKGKGKKRKINLKGDCSSEQMVILTDLQMDMDDDEDEPEVEFLNLPAHVITINLNKRELE